jgi:5-methyltetrahydropteroyltriglutamate--homocysteine methyltransferase
MVSLPISYRLGDAIMVRSAILGFPRIGAERELKKALESFWKGEGSREALLQVAKTIRAENWKRQKDAGISHIPSADFSLYDQVLDHIHMFGAIPGRYAALKDSDPLTLYFAMARGHQKDGVDVVAMEMTKWFDTNYHYLVPEFTADQSFVLTTNHTLDAYNEAKAQGIQTRPVIIGPVSFLLLGKMHKSAADVLSLLPKLLPLYQQLLTALKQAGAEWVQMDEPFLALDLTEAQKEAYKTAYAALKDVGPKMMVTTYFAGLRDNAALTFSLPVAGVHIDLVREPGQLDAALSNIKDSQVLSLGLVNGRNIWKTNYETALKLVDKVVARVGSDRTVIASSCSLLHSPVDLAYETALDSDIKSWLAFAVQKLDEVALLTRAVNEGREPEGVKESLAANARAMQARSTSKRIHDDTVKARMAKINDAMLERKSPFAKRIPAQEKLLHLPLLPTTTIGSFPQTTEIREARAKFKAGQLTVAQYEAFLESKTRECIQYQIDAGIDVPVHGEFERNDMVEYFGEQLKGYVFTKNGWVQSYGSRCVKPPVIFGDVSRPEPMTVRWTKFAQDLTKLPVKGMLTGPVTILQWSFVRDDQPREMTCKQIAMAIRDEVADLEKAGIHLIQIDEPAIREGLPLRQSDRPAYLTWAVDCFRLSSAVVEDATQIHTHMCYSEFNDIMTSIAAMDADVISIETSRSAMKLLGAFVDFKYPNQIGPGVYDIHSPRVPKEEEMLHQLRKALEVLVPQQVWVNPDCGLKTRGWKEVDPALRAMVSAAKKMRSELAGVRPKAANG